MEDSPRPRDEQQLLRSADFSAAARSPAEGSLRTVVLIGPPNSGKSTLFNRLTGLRQKVANYPGVTVEQRMGLMAGVGRDDLTLIDLPGVYSLTPYSEDARVAVDVLKGKMPGTPKPDAVLLVLDSLHLTRQLMLAAPVLAHAAQLAVAVGIDKVAGYLKGGMHAWLALSLPTDSLARIDVRRCSRAARSCRCWTYASARNQRAAHSRLDSHALPRCDRDPEGIDPDQPVAVIRASGGAALWRRRCWRCSATDVVHVAAATSAPGGERPTGNAGRTSRRGVTRVKLPGTR